MIHTSAYEALSWLHYETGCLCPIFQASRLLILVCFQLIEIFFEPQVWSLHIAKPALPKSCSILLDKPDRLYTLDLAAHRILIERKCFKEELIRRKAIQLACKFSMALAPLFSLPSKESMGLPFHTWGESVEIWKDRKSHMHEIFQIALLLKAESVVTESQYEFAVYRLGRTHCGDGDNKNSWILASFHIYDRPASGDHDAEHAGLVQTKNFVARTEGERAGAKHSKVMLFSRRNAWPVSSRISAPQKRPDPGYNEQGAVIETPRPSTGTNRQKSSAEIPSVSRKSNEAGCAAEDDRVREEGNISAPVCGECGEVFQEMLLFHKHQYTSKCTDPLHQHNLTL
jgi:hypothetical protein